MPALLTAAIVPAMIADGGGVVVNIGSVSGAVGSRASVLYGATKAALHSVELSCKPSCADWVYMATLE